MMEDLERLNLYHLDIKEENIMVTDEGHLKLIDFEMCMQRPPKK